MVVLKTGGIALEARRVCIKVLKRSQFVQKCASARTYTYSHIHTHIRTRTHTHIYTNKNTHVHAYLGTRCNGYPSCMYGASLLEEIIFLKIWSGTQAAPSSDRASGCCSFAAGQQKRDRDHKGPNGFAEHLLSCCRAGKLEGNASVRRLHFLYF
jgi:hypothetical protein